MSRRKEYLEKLVLSKREIEEMERAQFEIRKEGFEAQNEEKLRLGLSAFASVLSMAFMLGTPATLAAAVIAGITSSPSDRETLKITSRHGEDYMRELIYTMDDHPNYELIEVELPFLEFIDEGFRIVSGAGRVTAVKDSGNWIPM